MKLKFSFSQILLGIAIIAMPLIIGATTLQPAPCDADKTCFDLRLSSTTLIGDFYLDGNLVTESQGNARLTASPNTPHTLTIKNVREPGSAQFNNGIYAYNDVSVVQNGREGTPYIYYLTPTRVFVKGTFNYVCEPRGVRFGDNVACRPNIDGVTQPDVAANASATFFLNAGAHTVQTTLVGEQANKWSDTSRTDTTNIFGGYINWLTVNFNLKGSLRVILLPETLKADIYVDDVLSSQQVNTFELFTSNGSHKVEGRNFNDSAANGRYTYNNLSQNAFVGTGVTTYLYLQPIKIFSSSPVAAAPATQAPAPSGGSPVVIRPSGSFGPFELGGQVAGFGFSNLMKKSGMTWVKRQVKWRPGENANGVSGWINEAHDRGFKILLSVVGSPDHTTTDLFPQYAAFAGDLAALGADGIEVWNEQNIDREWLIGRISPQLYTELLKQAYPAIKAKNPNTIVISGAPSPTGYFGGCGPNGCDDQPYIEGMTAAGAMNYLDCVGIHYNEGVVPPTQTSGDPRGNPNHYTRYYQTMVDVYYAAAGGKRPLCFTELGYLSGQEWGRVPGGFLWKPPFNLTVAEQAQYYAQAVQLSRTQGKVRLAIIFNVDFTTWTDDPQAGYAMVRPDGSCPACDAVGNVMK